MLNSMGSAETVLESLEGCPENFDSTDLGLDHGVFVTEAAHYFRVAGCRTSGISVDWGKHLFDPQGPDGLARVAAEAPPGSGGVRFLPHLRYATPPYGSRPATGVFWGLHPAVTRAEMSRAILEGLAFDTQCLIDAMASLPASVVPTEIRAIGGSTRSELFMRIKAAMAPCRFVLLSQPEAVSQGAAILTGVAAGVYADTKAGVTAMATEGREVPRDPALAEVYGRFFAEEAMADYERSVALSQRSS